MTRMTVLMAITLDRAQGHGRCHPGLPDGHMGGRQRRKVTQGLGQEMQRALSSADVGKGLVLGLAVATIGLMVGHLILKWASSVTPATNRRAVIHHSSDMRQ
ncbi:hypothetical protein [Pseudogemmobacter sp. W21_MBD1_M6]|uniref:hypothetical protein n=1 Tax=Pseudogemmobacter sp. W21_MBD1_M6 TaxID=3240271 RepID=UPI003F9D8F3A